MTINVSSVKQKIIEYLRERGPSLPVNLTKISGMSLTFTSAILSELLAERKIKISNLKVGSSPLYYLEGQEEKLENFIDNLKPVEKDAFLKLKQNRILEDEKQSPQIRVALRSIKDFAVPVRVGEKLFWKYHLLSDEKAKEAIGGEKKEEVAVGQERVIGQSIWNDIKKEFSREEVEDIIRKRVAEIVEKIKEETLVNEAKKEAEEAKEEGAIEKHAIKEKRRPQKKKKTNPLFDFSKKAIEEKGFVIKEILKDTKDKVLLVCSIESKNYLVFVYGKKSVDDKEIFKDYKKYYQNYDGFFLFVREEKKQVLDIKKKFFEDIKEIFSF
ncbi:MAG: hypothetical protein QXX68_02035 [Candidatus Pacearchaeota archaeon]